VLIDSDKVTTDGNKAPVVYRKLSSLVAKGLPAFGNHCIQILGMHRLSTHIPFFKLGIDYQYWDFCAEFQPNPKHYGQN